jgi:hypothetical protein
MEVWLRTNTRALLFGMIPPALVELIGVLLVLGLPGRQPPAWVQTIGVVLMTLAGLTILALAWQLRKPRMAYHDRHVLLWLRRGEPIRVPVEYVECFLLGQAPSMLPGGEERNSETSSLVLRIAERAADWHRLEVKPQLGKWCEGYVTIRGTWCEPLNIQLVNRLNQRLYEVSRETAAH